MPYIHPDSREPIDEALKVLRTTLDGIPGDLNYALTSIVADWVVKRGGNYESICLATGVLENVKQEFYRRFAIPYEDTKISENGDVPAYEKQEARLSRKRK